MKIVVLAGGLSGERNVSLSSGTMVAQALRDRGHRVALADLFMGLEDYDGLSLIHIFLLILPVLVLH